MGSQPKSWFGVCMKNINGRKAAAAPSRRTRRHAKTPVALNLRVTMKSESSSWAVPLSMVPTQLGGKRNAESRRVELSLLRSVAQSGLKRPGSVWGR